MKKNQNQNQGKKNSQNSKKKADITSHINLGKKNVSIRENNSTIFNFFKISSVHKSTSTPLVPEARQTTINLNKDKDDSQQNYRLSRFNFYKSKQKKNAILLKKLTKNNEEKENKIDISNFILFNENFSNEIHDIFINNFIRHFKRFLDEKFKNEKNNKIGHHQNINISKTTFNKFIQQIFKYFIIKYLLNTYHNLIYVPEKYMMNQNQKNNLDEINLLSYNDKPNIYLEYLPINLIECNLFYPDLCSNISRFIKHFKQKKRKKKPNCALLLYRANNDFTSYITQIKLICNQLGYRLLIREDEVNKLMNIDKLKEINQNYIIGSLQDKNLKYLKILDNISITEKWTNFLESNNIHIISQQVKENDNKKSKSKTKNISKTQSTIDMTQSLTEKILLEKNNKQKNEEMNILASKTLTFIGHSNNDCKSSQESDKLNTEEYKIFQNYQQNILEKYNKRRNVILFVDNFENNEDNVKYINQINSIIPTSKSPIIILTNNLSFFIDNVNIGNTGFQTRYIPSQIENEGIKQKENVIYLTFMIIYFLVYVPTANFDITYIKEEKNKNTNTNNINQTQNIDKQNQKDLENELNFSININSENESSIDNDENKNFILEKIKKTINKIYIDTKLNLYNNEISNDLIIISNIISMINNYEIDNILVYLKNLFDLIKLKLQNQNIKQKKLILKNAVLLDIEKYELENEYYDSNEDISKIADIYDNNSFSDYEYGSVYNIAEKKYEEKIKNYGINKGIDYNKESYFYTNKYCDKYKTNYKYISNKEIEERIVEDHKFFQNYYNYTYTILNKSDITKINMILCQIIINERITVEDTSKFIGTRYSKRNSNYHQQNNNNNANNALMNDKMSVLNKLFRKCPFESFSRYINAHFGYNYYIEFTLDNKNYLIPEKLSFYNYYNDYYLMEQIQSENTNKYNENEEDEDDIDDIDEIDLNEEEEEYEEEEIY
jgi:hypothetical protein